MLHNDDEPLEVVSPVLEETHEEDASFCPATRIHALQQGTCGTEVLWVVAESLLQDSVDWELGRIEVAIL